MGPAPAGSGHREFGGLGKARLPRAVTAHDQRQPGTWLYANRSLRADAAESLDGNRAQEKPRDGVSGRAFGRRGPLPALRTERSVEVIVAKQSCDDQIGDGGREICLREPVEDQCLHTRRRVTEFVE